MHRNAPTQSKDITTNTSRTKTFSSSIPQHLLQHEEIYRQREINPTTPHKLLKFKSKFMPKNQNSYRCKTSPYLTFYATLPKKNPRQNKPPVNSQNHDLFPILQPNY
ncbi:hypothetical protein KC19_5G061400 [Ceratodon purpureus]|uniref:Uncharacterized protein n=1 Tax=Ceratodon purpureus TaxID=3225 RepID=A0A8T0HYE3_CERPU|nr:hypothetical protein KC19_5G061400 [Ceratodon purpureus]